ncbi:MAG: hypothetical protein NZ484_00560 [Patescibacteria group bacterium]|nr:hypothetical protein [Patescibacteria group bacterium]MCX7589454.1 hypothetical protein [Patescibacteria group bacterium]MDW8279634.1 hypothetical protein [bacterium]
MFNFFKNNKDGQVMIVVSLALGGVMMISSLIGGILILNQLRQARNLADSAKAIYAADAALEWGFYQFAGKVGAIAPKLNNGATSTTECFDANKNLISCSDNNTKYIIGKGRSLDISRAFQMSF